MYSSKVYLETFDLFDFFFGHIYRKQIILNQRTSFNPNHDLSLDINT